MQKTIAETEVDLIFDGAIFGDVPSMDLARRLAIQAYNRGYDSGISDGYQDGREDGYDSGYEDGKERGWDIGFDAGRGY